MRNEDLNPETQDSIQTQRRDERDTERERGTSSNMSSVDLKSEAVDRRGSKD